MQDIAQFIARSIYKKLIARIIANIMRKTVARPRFYDIKYRIKLSIFHRVKAWFLI